MAKGSPQYFSPPQGRGLFGKELVLCFGAKKKKKKKGTIWTGIFHSEQGCLPRFWGWKRHTGAQLTLVDRDHG